MKRNLLSRADGVNDIAPRVIINSNPGQLTYIVICNREDLLPLLISNCD